MGVQADLCSCVVLHCVVFMVLTLISHLCAGCTLNIMINSVVLESHKNC